MGQPHPNCEQRAFASIVRIVPDRVDELRTLLESIGNDINENPHVDFSKLTTVHFMRWVILDADTDLQGEPIAAQLLLSTNYDADLDDPQPLSTHLAELVGTSPDGVRSIYSHCVGFDGESTGGGVQSVDQMVDYLKRHALSYEAFYVGTSMRSVRQIRDEVALRDALESYIDEHARELADSRTAGAVREQLKTFVAAGPHSWALQSWPSADMPLRLRNPQRLLLGVGIATAIAIAGPLFAVPALRPYALDATLALIVVVGVFLAVLRHREKEDEAFVEPPPASLKKLLAREDHIVQNQMTSIAPMKPGKFRLFTIKAVFLVINAAARLWYTRGKLGEIPSIHFARWALIDDNRRLLFLSNFDGSWENYLGDFIDKASEGLTAIWSNTYKFPRSKFLVGGGARNEQVFKAMVRESQAPTEVWYSAYPRLSVQNVNNNTAIRVGLSGSMTEAEATEWLKLL